MEYIALYLTLLEPDTVEFLKALALALFLGYIMGAERELRHKDAGISTNMFVISGAMVFTFLSMTVDPGSTTRIAAQIVSGIGFLGAGLILKDGANVRNLTTAASLWYAAALGMLIGFGFYQIAFICGIVGVIIPRVHHFRGHRIQIEPEVIEPPKKKAAPKKKK
jgi:putative Mg2+ transporter-C (MgtC) family protein